MSDGPNLWYPEPPLVGDEAVTLLGSLERQRATFEWKCAGLAGEQLSRRVGTSQLSIARLLKHLAYMEDINFTRDLSGERVPEPWSLIDAETRSEWVFDSADSDSPATLYGLWRAAVTRSRTATRSTLVAGDLGTTYEVGNGQRATVRRLIVDMIEEYGRHTGHADLIRESVDGRVGEDPPGRPRSFSL